ncbi:PIG-L family deacetylase [Streptomyces shenzhenensis]|uniref:PIG-L family deacetylase n=1 Tax=Streptomyces shenzhenensis TaxID=943815 RepID=UPI0015F101CC|nr:PIG-L family deacetylase [Streptomyces shenzhenensis]
MSAQLEARAQLVVSPHPDDAVWSLGGRLAHWVEQGVPVTVVTIFDGPEPEAGPAVEPASESAPEEAVPGVPDTMCVPGVTCVPDTTCVPGLAEIRASTPDHRAGRAGRTARVPVRPAPITTTRVFEVIPRSVRGRRYPAASPLFPVRNAALFGGGGWV